MLLLFSHSSRLWRLWLRPPHLLQKHPPFRSSNNGWTLSIPAIQLRINAFWQKNGRSGADDRVAGDLRLRTMTGGMTIYRVEEDTETHLVAMMKENRGVYSESIAGSGVSKPSPLSRVWMGHLQSPPESSGNPAVSDDQLAVRVQEHLATMNGPEAFSGAILIAHNGKIVFEQAWGMADETNHMKNTTDTQFCIGSMNKMFTAVAILQLVGAGKLALDKSIVTYWPDYPNRDLAARVTIRELLNHTGGTGDIFTPDEANRQETRTLADYIKLFGTRPVAFEPGTRMEYSNYGFILLGRLIELVSGEPYQNFVQDHIYLPAGMMHTDSRPEADHVDGRAIGYTHGRNGLAPNRDGMPWSGTSAGGGYSTVRDLFLFAEALQSGKLLGPELLREAREASPRRQDYGMGFYVLPDGGYGHGGGAPGINGELHILPQSGYVLVALANRDPRMATNMVDFLTSILPVLQRAAQNNRLPQ